MQSRHWTKVSLSVLVGDNGEPLENFLGRRSHGMGAGTKSWGLEVVSHFLFSFRRREDLSREARAPNTVP